MAVDKAEWSDSERSATGDLVGNIRRWFSSIHSSLIRATRLFSRSREFAADVSLAQSDVREDGAREDTVVADATQNVNAAIRPLVSVLTVRGPKANLVAPITPDHEEIERRRNLVRMLFNGYWSGVTDKPAAFSARLDQAEDYLNERLAAQGEIWRLDVHTRVMLGLPPRSK